VSGRVVHVLGPHEYDEYVGRAMPRFGLKRHRYFANDMKVGRDGPREEVLAYFEQYARDHMLESPDGPFVDALTGLRGKTLACWCAPKDGVLTTEDETVCHAQIILRLADELAKEDAWVHTRG
jgi:hypothetical protein